MKIQNQLGYIKGITFAPFHKRGSLSTQTARDSFDYMIEHTAADFVILAPVGLQDHAHSEEICYTSSATFSDEELINMIRYAKSKRIRVALKPTVNPPEVQPRCQRGLPVCTFSSLSCYLLKSVPYLLAVILEAFGIAAVFGSQIRKQLSAAGDEQVGVHRWFRVPIPQQPVYLQQTRVGLWLMFLEVLEEIVPVERAEAAGGRLCVQPPDIQYVGVVVSPRQLHVHQRETVHKHRIRAVLAPLSFLEAEPHVHLVGLLVLVAEPLAFLVAEHFPADEL